MNDEDRRILIEGIAEMRELKGEMREFKEHVIGRVNRLEKNEGENAKRTASVLSLAISGAALAVSVIVNFFKRGKPGTALIMSFIGIWRLGHERFRRDTNIG
jgi:hypothetical protein